MLVTLSTPNASLGKSDAHIIRHILSRENQISGDFQAVPRENAIFEQQLCLHSLFYRVGGVLVSGVLHSKSRGEWSFART